MRTANPRSRHPAIALALGASLLLAGCAGTVPSASFSRVAESTAAIPAGEARIYFYRDYEPYESLARPALYLNGEMVGKSEPGGVSYRDVAPGAYRIKVASQGLYWHPTKTVTLAAGEVAYAKVESLASADSGEFTRDTFVVVLTAKPEAARQIAELRDVGGESR
ncbi:MAG TPA: DUF2846 domain-containing protein [Stellaceae bacterium]|nr:DUF2846 domain-containing protein [Stellaceae bacterium]